MMRSSCGQMGIAPELAVQEEKLQNLGPGHNHIRKGRARSRSSRRIEELKGQPRDQQDTNGGEGPE